MCQESGRSLECLGSHVYAHSSVRAVRAIGVVGDGHEVHLLATRSDLEVDQEVICAITRQDDLLVGLVARRPVQAPEHAKLALAFKLKRTPQKIRVVL